MNSFLLTNHHKVWKKPIEATEEDQDPRTLKVSKTIDKVRIDSFDKNY